MQVGMTGLGRMGANMTLRLLRGGHQVAVYDRSSDGVHASVAEGAVGGAALAGLVGALIPPLSAMRYEFGGHEANSGDGSAR